MENLKAIMCCAKNQPNIPRILSSREEALQPDVAYSDIQLTPRNEYEDDLAGRIGTRDLHFQNRNSLNGCGGGIRKEDLFCLQVAANGGLERKQDFGGEAEDPDNQAATAKGTPTI